MQGRDRFEIAFSDPVDQAFAGPGAFLDDSREQACLVAEQFVQCRQRTARPIDNVRQCRTIETLLDEKRPRRLHKRMATPIEPLVP